jgi:hypothetical protein
MKYWRQLLMLWRAQGHDGLSIPFIIGSQKYLPASVKRQNIAELVTDIAEDSACEIYLNYYWTVDDLILGIRSGKKLNLPVNNVLHQGKPSNLYISTFLKNIDSNTGSVIGALEERCQHYIDAKNYSINDNEHGDFTGDEIAFIKECFSKL